MPVSAAAACGTADSVSPRGCSEEFKKEKETVSICEKLMYFREIHNSNTRGCQQKYCGLMMKLIS